MKLEEMTNAQLVNIILRKDDIETRLREEIASLEKKTSGWLKRKEARRWIMKMTTPSLLENLLFGLAICS